MKLSKADRVEIFDVWFNNSGHWVYPTKRDAFQMWATKGIDGLPDCPSCPLCGENPIIGTFDTICDDCHII